MTLFIGTYFTLFTAVFVGIIVFTIIKSVQTKKHNDQVIKKFSLEGKTYLLYSKKPYNRYHHQITYELRLSTGEIIGTFNSLNDILVLLNIDEFPEEDMFTRNVAKDFE